MTTALRGAAVILRCERSEPRRTAALLRVTVFMGSGSRTFALGRNDGLERDDFSSNRLPALAYCWSMIFSENRYPLFGIML